MKLIIYLITCISVVICLSNKSYSLITDRIAAIVNEEIITFSEVEDLVISQKELLSKRFQGQDLEQRLKEVEQEALNSLIEKRLQIQMAKSKSMTMSQEEIRAAIDDIKTKNNFPDDDAFKKALKAENIDYDTYVSELQEQLTTIKLLNREVWKDFLIDEKEIRKYYEDNKESFSYPDAVKVSQILINFSDNMTEEEKDVLRKRANSILEKIKSGSDFSELAKEYSNDQSGGDLGFFERGDLMPDLDKAVFSLEPGEAGLVETSTAIHIIKVTDKKSSSYRSFDETKKDIEEILRSQKRDESYLNWMNDVRNHSYVEIKFP